MKRILCMLLILCCIIPLAACAGTPNGSQTTEPTQNTNETSAPIDTTLSSESDSDETTTPSESDETTTPDMSDVTTDPGDPPTPPEDNIDPVTGKKIVDLGGYRYKAYVRVNNGSMAIYAEDFWVEGPSEDVLWFSVYQRNQAIEAKYNCNIRQFDSEGDQYTEMTRFYLNDEKYELAILLGTSAAICATTNYLQNVYSLQNIDLRHAAYDQKSIAEFTFDEKLYFLSGDMNISTVDTAAVTIFNPDLFAKYDFVELCGNESYDDLYEMVAEGSWTVSAMLEIAEAANVDADKNGILSASDGDTVGYLSYSATPMYYWYGCGARVSTTDPASGYPTLTFGAKSDKALFDFLFDSINNKKEGNQWINNGGGGYRNADFMTDRLLFTDIVLWDVRKVIHPQNRANYGILPTPKYNAQQDRYYDLVYWPYGLTHLWSLPTKCADTDKASFMFHLMAQYSNAPGGTMDAYFTKVGSTGNPQDKDTLQIIKNSITYDMFLLYNWGGFILRLIEGLDTEETNLYEERVTEENLASVLADMNLTLERFKNPIPPTKAEEE